MTEAFLVLGAAGLSLFTTVAMIGFATLRNRA